MSDLSALVVVLSLDRDGYTGRLQLSIGAEDENGHGSGYRLFGPKYLGASTTVRRHVLSRRDRDEVRRYLDMAPEADDA